MTEPKPPRRPLATFLRPAPVDPAAVPDGPALAEDAQHETDGTADVPVQATVTEPKPSVDPPGPPSAAPSGVEAVEPGFLHARGVRAPVPRWQWAVMAALVMLLLLQIALADRARLAADSTSRPWIAALCGVVRCTLPAWHEPTAFSMLSREVRPVPGQPGVLQVQASIRNDARWAQQWPALRLSLSDADGRLIGSGVFQPRQYLGREDAGIVLDPGQSGSIAFQVREPAATTVAFTFEFL